MRTKTVEMNSYYTSPQIRVVSDDAHIKTYFKEFSILSVEDKYIEETLKSEETLFETIFVSQGTVRIEDETGSELNRGEQLLIIPPHSHQKVAFSEDTKFLNIVFNQNFLKDFCNEHWLRDLTSHYSSESHIKLFRLSRVNLLKLYRNLLDIQLEETKKKPGWMDATRIHFQTCMLGIARATGVYKHNPVEEVLSFSSNATMEKLANYLNENLHMEFSLEELGNKVGYSAGYLSRSFKAFSGLTVVEYINRARIQKACLLLKKSEVAVTDVAFKVGFTSLSYFNRTFKKVMQMSPSEYKKS